MSEQALKRLDEILKRAQGAEGGGTALPVQHGPTAMIVGYMAHGPCRCEQGTQLQQRGERVQASPCAT